uniref:Uncharacterized protein n=1 Tax=Sphaerodactylus townsendi TaxID=933632 RepID=A0ACB8FIU2_9SAUR
MRGQFNRRWDAIKAARVTGSFYRILFSAVGKSHAQGWGVGAGHARPVPLPLARTIPFFCNTNVDPFTRLETTATLKPSETAAGPGLGDPPSAPTILPTPGRRCPHEAPPNSSAIPSLLLFPEAGQEPAAALRDPP